MEKIGDEAAAKFINALIKSVQTLCHGYLEFHNGIEIIGHINLSVDHGTSLDYILKEKVCKNAENSTLFISNSFHAEPKLEQETSGANNQSGNQIVQNKQSIDSGESSRVSSAISSISTVLSGSRERSRRSSGTKDSESCHSHQSTAKRKASDDQSGEFRPVKMSSHHDNSHASPETFHPTSSSPVDSKLALKTLGASDDDMSETMLPQTANVTSDNSADIGVNLAGSVLEPVDEQSNPELPERDDDSDGDLEVTFIKEEYVEGERSACEFENSGQQFIGGHHQRASEGIPDPSLFPIALRSSSSASATYIPGGAGQHFGSGGLGASSSQPQPGPSGMRGSHIWNYSRTSNPARQSLHEIPQPATTDRFQPLRTSRTHHGAELRGFKALQCDLCDATFTSITGLRGHKNRVHLKKMPYMCGICGKGFTMRGHFIGHMNMHNQVKAFQCPTCSKTFAYRTSLRSHIRSQACSFAPNSRA